MAPATAEAVLSASQRASAALQQQLDAARRGLEAARAARASCLGPGSVAEPLGALEGAAEAASSAGEAFRRAHGEVMDLHYAVRRGEGVRPPAAGDGDAAAPEPSLEDRLRQKRTEAHLRKWAVPEDDGARRAAAAASAASGHTAAATAFAAAEEAAKKRLSDRPEGGAGAGSDVWYAWRTDMDLEDYEGEEESRQEAKTKVVQGQTNIDFSMFHRDEWERAQRQADALLAQQDASVFCWRESLPHPQSKVPGCMQVKVRHVQTNTEEKINRCYMSMAAGGGADRNGFLLGADLGRFMTLAKEKSDSPEAKSGGDLGWVTRGKLDPKLEEVAFACPRGACTPPFRLKLASFHILLCEDRR